MVTLVEMLHNTWPVLLAAALLTSGLSCSGDDDSQDDSSGIPFRSGHGVRKLAVPQSTNPAGSLGIQTADVTLSAPDRLEWCYGEATSVGDPHLSRVTLSFPGGEVLDEKGSLKGIRPRSLLEGGFLQYVPRANKLWSFDREGAQHGISGDVDFVTGTSDAQGLRTYANGDVMVGGFDGYFDNNFGQFGSDLIVFFRPAGATSNTQYLLHHNVPATPDDEPRLFRAMTFERVAGGDIIALALSGSQAVARRMNDDTELASVPYDGLAVPFHSKIIPRYMTSKLSADGSRIAAMEFAQESLSDPLRITTVTYDVPTHTIKVVLSEVVPEMLTTSFLPTLTFDLDGNLYFGANVDLTLGQGLSIVKQTSTGPQVLATGFLPDNAYVGLDMLRELDGRVFLTFTGAVDPTPSNKVDRGPQQILGIIE